MTFRITNYSETHDGNDRDICNPVRHLEILKNNTDNVGILL